MYRDDGGRLAWTCGTPARTVAAEVFGSGVADVAARTAFGHPAPQFNRLFLMHRGRAVATVGRTAYRLAAGSAWLLPIRQSFRITYEAGCRFHFFHLRWSDVLGRDAFADWRGLHAVDLGPIASLLREAHGPTGEAPPAHWHLPLFLAMEACSRLHAPGGAQPPVAEDALVREVAESVQQQPNGVPTVGGLARRRGLTPGALSQRFRRAARMPLQAYLQQVRIERACRLLIADDRPVSEVAATLGFTDHFYFQRFFKRITGSTPTAYRRAVAAALGAP